MSNDGWDWTKLAAIAAKLKTPIALAGFVMVVVAGTYLRYGRSHAGDLVLIFGLALVAIGCAAQYEKAHRAVVAITAIAVVGIVIVASWYFGEQRLHEAGDVSSSTVNATSFSVPDGWTFEQAARVISQQDNITLDVRSCPASLLNARLAPGPIQASDSIALLETLALRLQDPAPKYEVKPHPEKGVYEVRCK